MTVCRESNNLKTAYLIVIIPIVVVKNAYMLDTTVPCQLLQVKWENPRY